MKFLRSDAEIQVLYDLSRTIAEPLLQNAVYPWDVLSDIGKFILEIGETLSAEQYEHPSETIWIARDAKIAASASIEGPSIISSGAELRQGAFMRGNVIVGKGAVVGNSTELKNCILFDGAQVPHFNYAGDSILGYRAHMGAGAITSNVKSDRTNPVIRCSDGDVLVGRRKCGAFVGDFAEIGCGSVLNPGTVIGRRSSVYPLSSVRGCIPPDCICKGDRGIFPKKC